MSSLLREGYRGDLRETPSRHRAQRDPLRSDDGHKGGPDGEPSKGDFLNVEAGGVPAVFGRARTAPAHAAPTPAAGLGRGGLLRAFACALLATLGILLVLLALLDCAPFGSQSLASGDAPYQYLYFFDYLKDVFAGRNAIDYTFSNQLGGSGVGVYSYYLASPFNVLLLLFDKAEVNTFFDVVVVLKLSLAAGLCAVFLRWRFPRMPHGLPISVALALSYAFSQCVLFQADNVMWQDGIYLLPAMLLGVSLLVRRGSIWPFALLSGLAILFNWYSGFISLAYTFPWLLVETLAVGRGDRGPEASRGRTGVGRWPAVLGGYALGVAIALCVSAILLLPTVLRMLAAPTAKTLGGEVASGQLIQENVGWLAQAFVFGGMEPGEGGPQPLCLWAGALILCGGLAVPFASRFGRRQRAVATALLLCALSPFVVSLIDQLLGLLKPVESYWPRYGYGSMAYLAIVCAWWLDGTLAVESGAVLGGEPRGGSGRWRLGVWLPSLCYLALLAVLGTVHRGYGLGLIAATGLLVVVCLALLTLLERAGTASRLWGWALAVFCALASLANGYLVLTESRFDNVEGYRAYVDYGSETFDALREGADSSYRASIADVGYGGLSDTILGNASFAFGFPSIESYTSSPDGRQLAFLETAGYRSYAGVFSAVRTSLLPVDSLLGVRYVLANQPINGLEPLRSIGGSDDPVVYENPYALPLAFRCDGDASGSALLAEGFDEGPFAYQDALYTALLGEEAGLFTPAAHTSTDGADGDLGVRDFTIEVPEGRWGLYGRIPAGAWVETTLSFDDGYETNYDNWVTSDVFYIPTVPGETTAHVRLRAADLSVFSEADFQLLDLDRLGEVVARLGEGGAAVEGTAGGDLSLTVAGTEGRTLFTSVPTDPGWQVTRNGEPVEPGEFAGLFLTLPLADGENAFALTYHLPGLLPGLVLTVVGLSAVVFLVAWERRERIVDFARPYLGLLRQGSTYLAVGLGTAVLELVLFEALYRTGLDIAVANVSAVCVSTAANFALNGTVTFKGSSNFARSLVLYLLLFAANTTFSTFTIGVLVEGGLPSLIAKGLTMVCIVCWNFVLYKKVVFV